MKHTRSYIPLLIFIFIAVISGYFIYFHPRTVTSNQFENYALTFVDHYNQDLSYFQPETFDSFDFYSNQSYCVTAYLSSTYGTAIIFDPSENWSFETVYITQRVEDAIFGEYNSYMSTNFHFQSEQTGMIAEKNSNVSIINIGLFADEGSNVLFKNININSVLYNCLIIKGDRSSKHWNDNTAISDSKRIYNADVLFALNRSEEVRMRYYEPELNTRLLEIISKWDQSINSNGEVTYSYTQKEHDIQQLEELASTKYHITNSSIFIENLLKYLSEASLPPQKIVFGFNDPDNWIYTIVSGIQPSFSYMLFILLERMKEKLNSIHARFVSWTLKGVFLLGGGYSIVVNYPYDFKLLSIQTIIIALMWIIGLILVYKNTEKIEGCFENNK